MRSAIILLLLGLALATVAVVVRTGILARSNPGRPINSAMREALGQAVLPEKDAALLAQKYPDAIIAPSGLRYIVRTPGTSKDHPQNGAVVTVNYDGRFLDGAKFDTSADHGGPFNFVLGTGRVIPGWDEAIRTMKKGEKRTLIIPYWLGYGEKGIRGKIPAKATLVFEVELLDWQ
ncbi:MAG TPA: FKBP-type peptidyl-prolyl cis-trans isomerase [Opitutaceae bacterium]